jgi:hypothetical protein
MPSLAGSLPRVVLAALVIVGTPFLSACEQLENFELWDTKKKLPGDRKEVFPDGVPGVTSGVPPELVKGYREPEGPAPIDPAKAAAEAAAAEHEPAKFKPKPPPPQRTASKPPSKPVTVAGAPPSPSAPPTQQAATPPSAAPPGAATLPWPSGPPQPQAAWPGTTPPGTATR